MLNNSLNREFSEVQIEYKTDKGKKVRVQSAPKEMLKKRISRPKESDENDPPTPRRDMSPHMHYHEHVDQKQKEMERRKKKIEEEKRKGPVREGSRPKWNYKNTEYKKPTKQSEKDPFYIQKKRDSEFRRQRREQKLLAMVEANKAVIPDYSIPTRRSRTQSPQSDYGGETSREVRPGRRSKSHSPKRPKLDGQSDYISVNNDNVYTAYERTRVKSPVQETHESHTDRTVTDNRASRSRVRSPPIPAIKHKSQAQGGIHAPVERPRKGVSSYSDIDPLDVPVQNGDFVPFTRTIDVLDPAKAGDPLPLSREATQIANARKVYHGGLQPDKYGNRQHVFRDKQRLQNPADDSKVYSRFVLGH